MLGSVSGPGNPAFARVVVVGLGHRLNLEQSDGIVVVADEGAAAIACVW